MRNLIFILFFHLFCVTRAQELVWQAPQELGEKGSHHSEILGKIDSMLYLKRYDYGLRLRKTHFIDVFVFNKQQQAYLKKTTFTIEEKADREDLVDAFIFGKKIYIVRDEDTGKDSVIFYFTELNTETGKESVRKLLTNVLKIDQKFRPPIQIRFSNDSTKLLLANERTDLYSPLQAVNITVYDQNFKQENKKYFDFTSESKSTKIENYFVTNNGDIAMSVKTRNKNFDNNFLNYIPTTTKILIHSFEKNQSKIINITLPDSAFVASNIYMKQESNSLFINGLIGHARFTNIVGTVLINYNVTSGNVNNEKAEYLNPNSLKEILGINHGWKQKDLGNHYTIKQLFFGSDESISVFAEQGLTPFERTLYLQETDKPLPAEEKKWLHSIGNGIIIKFDKTGNFNWLKMIPKDQSGGHMGSKSFFKNETIYLVYNDNLKNLKGKDEFGPRTYVDAYDGAVVLTSVNKNGNIESRELKSIKNQKFALIPQLTLPLNTNQFLVYSSNLKEFRIGTLTFIR